MTLEMMKELFGIVHDRDDEEEVPNAKCRCIIEQEVLLSQPITAAVSAGPPVMVPPEEEEVLVPQGTYVAVPPEEDVPLEEDDFPAPAIMVPHATLSWSHQRKRRSQQPPYHSPTGRKGMPCPGIGLRKFFALLFFSKMQKILFALFLINVVDL
jgi:hypothetical protein